MLGAAFVVVLAMALTGGLGASAHPSAAGHASSAAPSGSGSSSTSGGPTSTSTSTSTPLALAKFALPSGNIACEMSTDRVRCTIASSAVTPSPDATCTGTSTSGHEYVVDSKGVHIPCVDGPAPGVAPGSTPVLEYGSTSKVGGYSCASATDGVTCIALMTGVGFRLARAGYTELP